jgi:hypothetical protein
LYLFTLRDKKDTAAIPNASLPRAPSFALPQKKQKGSRHIRFAKNQWQNLNEKNSPAAQTAFRS